MENEEVNADKNENIEISEQVNTPKTENKCCKNCSYHFINDDNKFCPKCGQTTATHRINYHFLFHEFQHGVLHVDKGILFTIKELFTRPGKSIKDYLEGKRINHFKPFLLLVIIAAFSLFANEVVEKIEGNAKHELIEVKSPETIDKENKKNAVKISQFEMGDQKIDQKILSKNISAAKDWLEHHHLYILITVPLLAISLSLFFKFNKRYNFPEYLVIATFLIAQFYIFRFVYNFFNLFLHIKIVGSIISFGFFVWSMKQIFDDKKLFSIVTRSFFSLICYAFLIFISILIGSVIVIGYSLAFS